MTTKLTTTLTKVLSLLLTIFFEFLSFAQDIPLVYNVENTSANCSNPVLSTIEELPVIRPLTDPFEWSDSSGRSTKFEDWKCRRAEIKAEIEHYEIGKKPSRPEQITASFLNDTLTVNVTVNGNTLKLTSHILLPEGNEPFPAVIGVGRGSGSLPADIFASRNIAQIAFNFTQVMSHTQTRGNEPINKLYPELEYFGAYSAWSWGISRIIDGLELVSEDLNIDLKHLAVTGCSFAGKMALFAGAFDERIALTISQESGGGGAAAWRVSETLGNVETLGRTSGAWFIEDMFKFSNSVPKLPYDHHELMAMVAPRALLILGNPDYQWLADESGYVSSRAAHEVWKTFGIGDRFGFSIVDGHNHCQLPDSQKPEVEAFVEMFLLGNTEANTNVQTHGFDNVDYERWYNWWESGEPNFPEPDTTNIESVYFEAECASVGSNWNIIEDESASNNKYVTIKTGLNSTDVVPSVEDAKIKISFTVSKNAPYYVYAKLNCPSSDDDSFWVKIDDNDFITSNGLRTNEWEWVKLSNANLEAGEHTLTIAYREDGAKIDKIGITSYIYGPSELGEEFAKNCD
ncbi:hypothetical protein MBM09_09420 [Flaviramulus sp. BrNp1-15]|uniref:glucuronyl esterase domain-containing protein n=1 Tax=Flaviramulus sp. BrNp1-15 TaxID=2916754 RepID=UPI001EE8EC93|nr:hypothetical protein [Flaviramulus sp. BrNp1-15]ULC58137.1 hypothetical protein MBM09_09420 [Flaviramulus sp. BrNp1-15]